MAVVQISRIQVRRGRKGDADVPTLASGEIGWAIDKQELYIGNGAVSEGAPATGNTRILTEHDNLFDLIGSYSYSKIADGLYEVATGPSDSQPIERTIQQKLDDIVSVRDFGALGDGQDQTENIQRAIDELFLPINNGGLNKNVTLRVPAGTYLISKPLNIPPHANIIGDGPGKTFFQTVSPNNAQPGTPAPPSHIFRMVNDSWVPDLRSGSATGVEEETNSDNQSRKVLMQGFTIEHNGNGGAILLRNTYDSVFDNIEIYTASTTWDFSQGDGIFRDGSELELTEFIGIQFEYNSLNAYPSENNRFTNCIFRNMVCAVDMPKNANFNTFDKCKFENVGYAFILGEIDGDPADPQRQTRTIPDINNKPKYNIISNSYFNDVYREAVRISAGVNNRSYNNNYLRVGNNGGSSASAAYPILTFNDVNNVTENDFFKRTQELSLDFNTFTSDEGEVIDGFADFNYVPEVKGIYDYKNNFPISKSIGVPLQTGESSLQTTFMYLPAVEDSGFIEIDYTYTLRLETNQMLRKGTLSINYDQQTSGGAIQLGDDYVFIGDPTRDELLTFSARLDTQALNVKMIEISVVNEMLLDGENYTDKFECTLRQKSGLLPPPQ